MKQYFFVFVGALVMLIFSSTALAQRICNHKHSFGRSAVADSVAALHYHIHITSIDFTARQIQAITTVTLVPKVELLYIPLELKALQVDSVFVNQIHTADFFQQGDILRVSNGQLFDADDTLTLRVHYGGTPFNEAWGGFHFAGNYAFNLGVGFESNPHNLGKAWFPCVDDFQDRATYEVLITLPEGMTGIAGGLLVETIDNGDGTFTWHWSLNKPIPTYLASVAAGNYALTEEIYSGVEANIPITIYTRPGDTAKVAGTFQNLPQVMDVFEEHFYAYPWDRVGYTGTAIGAMEHVTNIAYPHFTITGNLDYEELMVHELSHMWFGNMVTCATEGDMWLNEGWATFCQYYYQKYLYGQESYRDAMRANHFSVLRDAHITDGSYLPLSGVPTEYVYGKTVYDKGATVVHTLMYYLGEEVFLDAVRAYLNAFAFNDVSSADMRDFMSAHTGFDLTSFFEAWVFTPGTPQFSIDSVKVIPAGDQFETYIHLKQKFKGHDFLANDNILEVTFMDAEWQKYTDTVHFSGQNGISVKLLDFEPVLALADYFDKSCDATTDEDYVFYQPGEWVYSRLYLKLFIDALPDSAFLRLTHHWAAPDALKQNIGGLSLSPYRYWQIAGIVPEGTAMRGRFFYSNVSTLDNTLITSPTDSVVVMYRQNAADDWHAVSQFRQGLWNIGFIFVDELLPGEYTLAVWDTQVGVPDRNENTTQSILRVFPNPAGEVITIELDRERNGNIKIYDGKGRPVYSQAVSNQSGIRIETHLWPAGVYVATLTDAVGNKIGSTKFIIK
jgi:aminopeptidase N